MESGEIGSLHATYLNFMSSCHLFKEGLMVALHSTRLNEADYTYFRNNFKVKDTNVSSLEEADVILFGEMHTSLEHRLKNCWLLNKLACQGDTIYLEGYSPDSTLNKDDFQRILGHPIFPDIKFKGWDCKDSTSSKFLSFFKNASTFTSWLEKTVLQQEKGTLSDGEKLDAIRKMATFFSKERLQKALDKMQKYQFSFDDHYQHVLTIPDTLNKLATYVALAEKADSPTLTALFFLSGHAINEAISLWNVVEIYGMNFYRRNLSLAKQISEFSEEGKKVFAIAGKAHLFHQKRYGGLSHVKGVELLNKTLKEKKYAILFPTKGRENIRHAEILFERPPLRKLVDLSRKFFSECLRPQRRIGWLSIGGILTLAAKTDYFFYIAPSIIFGTFGIIAKETYENLLAPKPLCVALTEDFKKRGDLEARLSKKIDLIPDNLYSQIEACFSQDGVLKDNFEYVSV